ncbi:proline-rich protein 2-like [Peromyscus leucopus]|uniref:proline-rich protein 2-like n=1 Tax=Peromyscus leucopus TaxID=10041 RepID=UPI001884D694|nr:proline-rich protein 2-like [Peromyscus leucopus]
MLRAAAPRPPPLGGAQKGPRGPSEESEERESRRPRRWQQGRKLRQKSSGPPPPRPRASPGARVTAGAPQFHRVCPTPSGSHSVLPEPSGGPWAHRPELAPVLLHAQPLRLAPSSEGSEGGAQQQVSFRAAVKMAVPGRSPLGSDLAAPLRGPRVHVRPRPRRRCQSSGPSAGQAAAFSLPRRSQSVLLHLPPPKVRVAFWPRSGRVQAVPSCETDKQIQSKRRRGTPEGRGPRQQPPPPPPPPTRQELRPSPNFPAPVA